MEKDFWSNAPVAVLGSGNFGMALTQVISKNVGEVRIWVRQEEISRQINSQKSNPKYLPEIALGANVKAYSDLTRVFEGGVLGVIWVLPSKSARTIAKEVSGYFRGDEILFHATKGIEEGTLKRISTVLEEEIPCPRIGVVSGPNLAKELAKEEPAATVIASNFDEVLSAGQAIFTGPGFRVYPERDVIGVEWAGSLKNILAIASGALDSMGFGWNARAMLLTRGLAEMVRFGKAMGAKSDTFLGLAGIGDLLATCASPNSRNYRVGYGLAQGKKLEEVLSELGSVAEGVRTAQIVYEYAKKRGIQMPITEGVNIVLSGKVDVKSVLTELMKRPIVL